MGIIKQILGGLCLDLQERFPDREIELDELFEEPAVVFGSGILERTLFIVIDNGMFKVVVAEATPPSRMLFRSVLFEYSFVEPDADFEPLFEFLEMLDRDS